MAWPGGRSSPVAEIHGDPVKRRSTEIGNIWHNYAFAGVVSSGVSASQIGKSPLLRS